VLRNVACSSLIVFGLLVLAGCGSSSKTAKPPATATVAAATTATTTTSASFVPATCTAQGSNAVQCTLPDVASVPAFNLQTLLSEAQAVNSSVTASTPMVITAFGAVGHGGYAAAAGDPGSHGDGGEAQTTTTISAYEAAYGTPALYYFLGMAGAGTYSGIWKGGVGGLGGASTIVSPYNLTSSASTPKLGCITGVSGQYNESGCSSTTVVLIAGGGGGGGEGATCDGGDGGDGGTAVATTSGPASDAGGSGGGTGCYGGHGGHGGSQGNGGSGGSGGDGVDHHAGGDGNDGAGGLGGDVHTSDGSSPTMPWTNVGYCLYKIGNSGSGSNTCPVSQSSPPEWGKGGEGQWRGSAQPVGGGGGGGGGWGGGGGGGGGGNSDPGGGGGGGGSFAAQSTTATPSGFTTPSNPGSDGSVIVTFVT